MNHNLRSEEGVFAYVSYEIESRIRRLSGDDTLAEEAVLDGLERLARYITDKGELPNKKWLDKSIHGRVMEALKRRSKEIARNVDIAQPVNGEDGLSSEDMLDRLAFAAGLLDNDLAEQVGISQEVQEVLSMLDRLSGKKKAVAYFFFVEGLSYAKIVQQVPGVTESSARKIVSRLPQELRSLRAD